MLILENPSTFAQSALGEITIYTIYINSITDNLEDSVITMPDYLKDYTNIFSNDTAGLLLKHQGTNYVINLMLRKELSFGLIYNLLEKELWVL